MCIVGQMVSTTVDFGEAITVNKGVLFGRLIFNDEIVAKGFRTCLSEETMIELAGTHEKQASSIVRACHD